jgi:hypothetical protein
MPIGIGSQRSYRMIMLFADRMAEFIQLAAVTQNNLQRHNLLIFIVTSSPNNYRHPGLDPGAIS